MGTCLRVPQRVLFECLSKNAEKHSKSSLWGTPRQVPKIAHKALRGALSGPDPRSTPVNGGRDRNDNTTGRKEYTPPPWHPSSLALSPNPRSHRAKASYGVRHSLGKQGKKAYTICPERRVYAMEAPDPEKIKKGGRKEPEDKKRKE